MKSFIKKYLFTNTIYLGNYVCKKTQTIQEMLYYTSIFTLKELLKYILPIAIKKKE